MTDGFSALSHESPIQRVSRRLILCLELVDDVWSEPHLSPRCTKIFPFSLVSLFSSTAVETFSLQRRISSTTIITQHAPPGTVTAILQSSNLRTLMELFPSNVPESPSPRWASSTGRIGKWREIGSAEYHGHCDGLQWSIRN